jgi:hypothetical protein
MHMFILDPQFVRASLHRLAVARVNVFGVEWHRFVLTEPLPEQLVRTFEQRHRVRLPEDYRHFITHIGNGGAGPDYGLFPLGYRDGNSGSRLQAWSEGDGFVGVLSQPFQLDEPWNDTSRMPDLNPTKGQQEECDRQMDAFEARYWSASLMNGAFPICHRGCAIRLWLVVTGNEAGHIWRDGRADYTGLAPLLLSDGSRAVFSSWYSEWLEDCLVRVRQ